MTAGSLTGVVGVARRYRAWRNAGGPLPRGVATLNSADREHSQLQPPPAAVAEPLGPGAATQSAILRRWPP